MEDAILDLQDGKGYLTYRWQGRIYCVPVTTGPSYERFPGAPEFQRGPVWHVDVAPDVVTVSPSIHVGRRLNHGVEPAVYETDHHTGNPVAFRRLPDGSLWD